MVARTNPPTSGPRLVPGSVWEDISPRGRGETAYVTNVTGVNVQFKVRGRASVDPNRVLTQPVNAFLVRHTLKQPAPPVRPRKEKIKQVPLPPRISNTFDLNTRLRPEPEDPTVDAPQQYSRKRKLGRVEAREIYELVCRDKMHPIEVGEAYGISRDVVDKITAGVNYANETEDLRIMWPRPSFVGSPSQSESPPVVTPEPPVEKEEPVALPESVHVCHDGCTVGHHPANPPVRPAPVDPPAAQRDPLNAELEETRKLLRDCGEAIQALLEYHGKPLPKFLVLDIEGIRALASEAITRTD
jgi:hypothetical protein